jgi:hypothetical protein
MVTMPAGGVFMDLDFDLWMAREDVREALRAYRAADIGLCAATRHRQAAWARDQGSEAAHALVMEREAHLLRDCRLEALMDLPTW